MPKPHEAVRAAIDELWNGEFMLADVVDLAEKKLGEDASFYQREFLRIALAKKAAAALRAYRETVEQPPTQVDLFGDLPQRVLPVPQDDGGYLYKRVKRMTWVELKLVRAERQTGIVKDQKELDGLERLMRDLAPMMALNDGMIVEDAIIALQGGSQQTAAE